MHHLRKSGVWPLVTTPVGGETALSRDGHVANPFNTGGDGKPGVCTLIEINGFYKITFSQSNSDFE
jgi:hypothetical protein